MAKKPVNLDPYKQRLLDGGSLEHIAEVSGATLDEVRAWAGADKVTTPSGDANPAPSPEPPASDVNTDALHDPIPSTTHDDVFNLLSALAKRVEILEADNRALKEEVRHTKDQCASEIARVRLDVASTVEAIKYAPKGAEPQERGGCPTVVKVVCDSITIPGQHGGVHPFKRGDVISTGINGEYLVAALWARGPKVCVAYGS